MMINHDETELDPENMQWIMASNELQGAGRWLQKGNGKGRNSCGRRGVVVRPLTFGSFLRNSVLSDGPLHFRERK